MDGSAMECGAALEIALALARVADGARVPARPSRCSWMAARLVGMTSGKSAWRRPRSGEYGGDESLLMGLARNRGTVL
jgi:hypothetical protein